MPGYKVGGIGVLDWLRPLFFGIVLMDILGEIWGSLDPIVENIHWRPSLALRSRDATLYTYRISEACCPCVPIHCVLCVLE